MANYPPTPSFGLNFGAPTAPAATTPGSAYNATTSTYSQDHTRRAPARSIVSNQVDSYTAFHENRHVPAFSAAAVASGIPPLPIFPDWSAPALWPPGPPLSHTPIGSEYASNGSNVPFISQDQLPYGYMPAASNMSVKPSQENPKNYLGVQEPEEGELSEGDHANNAQFTSTSIQDNRLLVNQNNDLYSHDDEYEPAPAVPDDDDDAYSPVASPMPLEEYPSSSVLKEKTTLRNSRNVPPMPYHDDFTNSSRRAVDENQMDIQMSNLVANKSPAEVLKLAENAVLNLMPAKVSFQDYLDEGVSEDLIKRIFDNLRLPQTPVKATDAAIIHTQEKTQGIKTRAPGSTAPSTKPIMKGIEQSKPAPDCEPVTHKDNLNNSTANINSKALPVVSNKATKAEERKDMIARLMAEKANKKSAVPPAPTAPPQSTTIAGPAPASQPSPKIDKQQLLLQKMEALQKSREARAAKIAQNTESTLEQSSGPPSIAPKPMLSNTTNSPTSEQQPVPTQIPVRTSSEPRLQTSVPMAPSIPGLFLASTASPHPSPSASTIMDPFQSAMQRKRPVASDFDEPTPSVGAYKRPFGHSRYDQRLVIDVSDEDNDEESDMDIDEPSDDSSSTPIVQQGNTNLKSIRDQPPLTDVPSRKIVTKPAPSISSPSTPQGNFSIQVAPSDRIKMHELAILEMRKKIEEAEARKKAKRAQSGTQTPHSVASSSASEKATETSIAQKVADSVRIEQMIDDVNRKVDLEKQKLADEQQKATELQQIEAERKKVIQEDTKSKRLAELQAEIARHDAAIQRGIEEKRRLAEEMEKLGQEADEQLQADTDRLCTLQAAESTETQTPAGHSPDRKSTASPIATTTSKEEHSSSFDSTTTQDKEDTLKLSNTDTVMTNVSASKDEAYSEVADKPVASLQDPFDKATPDQDLELALQHASAETEDLQITERGKSEQVSVEVEENHPPKAHESAAPSVSSPAADEVIASNANSTSVSDEHENGESEDYEPPEATPPVAEVQSWVDTPAFSSLEATPAAIPASPTQESRGQSPVVTNEVSTADDLSGFEQPLSQPSDGTETAQADAIITVNSHDNDKQNDPSPYTFFTPYESPLKHFRAFRFHPKFSEEVAGGFRSLTYSHKIQQDRILCRYELAGGICNDSTCDMQHFRELSIPDDAILVHLGDSSAYSESDKANFIKGLREVLQDLRVKKAKDFQTIAAEIAAFRSKFLKDSSRVLTLDTPAL